jgi:hypothetical protein
VDVHFVTIEVCVKGRADALIETKGLSLRDLYPEAHHTDSVETGLTVEDNHVAVP